MASSHSQLADLILGGFDFIAQAGGLFEVFRVHRFIQFLLQILEAIRQIAALAQSLRDLANVPGALVHRLEESFEALGKSDVTLRATEASSFFEVGLCETATGAMNLLAAADLGKFL